MSSLPGRSLRWLLGRAVGAQRVVPILQGPARGLRWVAGSFNHGCWLGSYEFDKQRRFVAHLAPGMVVYDIGANVGLYTLIAARAVGPSGAVYALEPLPVNLEFLRRHVALNHLSNVEVVAAAAAASCRAAHFNVHASRAMGSLDPQGRLEVQCLSLDSRLGAWRAPHVLKIDVEGAENEVLLGAERTLASVSVIFLALHGPDQRRFCLSFLRDRGFALTALDNRGLDSSDEILALRMRI